MPKMTPGYAKNIIRRALRAVVDPEPKESEILEMWEHFNSRCAYCGKTLSKPDRHGHVDHLVSTGTNHISNRVLSCPTCNGDEKLDENWEKFLEKKAPNESTLLERRARIESWRDNKISATPVKINTELLDNEIKRAVQAFDTAVENLRSGRKGV